MNVCRLGIGGGRGLSSDDLLYAFDAGINYFFWSSDLHHHLYAHQVEAIRKVFGRSSRRPKDAVLAVATYIDHPEKALSVIRDQLLELNIDYVDVLFWGWMTMEPTEQHAKVIEMVKDPEASDRVRQKIRRASQLWTTERYEASLEAASEAKKQGYARAIGGSFHDRNLARKWLQREMLDVVMLRYHPCNRKAEDNPGDLLAVPPNERPGVVCFNTAQGVNYALGGLPQPLPGLVVPEAVDFYRFAWRLPWVDVVLTGPKSRGEIDSAIAALESPELSEDKFKQLIRFGDQVTAASDSKT